jgi:von Willebrand factor type A domain
MDADGVVSRLSALTQAARVFGSGVAGVDLDIGWSPPGQPERMLWTTGEDGRRRVEIRLDLDRMTEMSTTGTSSRGSPVAASRGSHVEGFQSAFLHELGHVLYSGHPPGEPLIDEERMAVLAETLPGRAHELSARPEARVMLNQIGEILEDARIERRLIDRFRGARRYLAVHVAEALDAARGSPAQAPARPDVSAGASVEPRAAVALGMQDIADLDGCPGGSGPAGDAPLIAAGIPAMPAAAPDLARLVALLFLQIWGADDEVAADELSPRLSRAAARLRSPLLSAVSADDPTVFADWLVSVLLVEIAESFPEAFEASAAEAGESKGEAVYKVPPPATGQSLTGERREAPGEMGPQTVDHDRRAATPAISPENATSLIGNLAERLSSPGLLGHDARAHTAGAANLSGKSPLQPQLIIYPRMDGSRTVDEVSVAMAHLVPPTVHSRQVLEQVVTVYGPPALEAFAGERAALRRAFEVNFERRFAGRYRSGRRVGMRNLRRLAVSRDLRLFQRMEVPDRLSYYFHLLIDVSPSMLTNRNAAKAVAVGYAFAEALDRLRVPVDVSLYSAAVTELYDHRRDRLDRFFGGDFGYYSSGTHEIEAIAYAKQKADTVNQTRKLIVVLTDGHPNSVALQRAGAADLRSYYRDALIPWLRRAGIDLLAIGIGHSPSYHENAVSIGSSWQSIGVLMHLLDGVIAEGRKSHAELWQ